MTHSDNAPLTLDEVAALQTAVRMHGEHAVLRATGLSRIALYRCMSGLRVYAGTRSLVRTGLARCGAPTMIASGDERA